MCVICGAFYRFPSSFSFISIFFLWSTGVANDDLPWLKLLHLCLYVICKAFNRFPFSFSFISIFIFFIKHSCCYWLHLPWLKSLPTCLYVIFAAFYRSPFSFSFFSIFSFTFSYEAQVLLMTWFICTKSAPSFVSISYVVFHRLDLAVLYFPSPFIFLFDTGVKSWFTSAKISPFWLNRICKVFYFFTSLYIKSVHCYSWIYLLYFFIRINVSL